MLQTWHLPAASEELVQTCELLFQSSSSLPKLERYTAGHGRVHYEGEIV